MTEERPKDPDEANPESRVGTGVSPRSGTAPPVESRFKPGQSGNPGGRSKLLAEVRQEFMKDVPHLLRRLYATAMGNPNSAVGVAAAKEFLDRVTGKAPQPIIGEDGAPPVTVNIPELVATLRRYVSDDSAAENVSDPTEEQGTE